MDFLLQVVVGDKPPVIGFHALSSAMQFIAIVFGPLLTFVLGVITVYYQNRKNTISREEASKTIARAHSDESYKEDAKLLKMAYALRDHFHALRCCIFLLHNGGVWVSGRNTDFNHKKKITCLYEAPDPTNQARSMMLDFNDRLVQGQTFEWINRLRESKTGIEYTPDCSKSEIEDIRMSCGLYGAKSTVNVLIRDDEGHAIAILTVDFVLPNQLDDYGVAQIAAEGMRIGKKLQK